MGSTVTLSDGATGGTWISSNTVIATIDPTGIVSGILKGTATISLHFGFRLHCYYAYNGKSFCRCNWRHECVYRFKYPAQRFCERRYRVTFNPAVTVGSATGIVTGVSLSTATIIYTTPAGCTADYLVTVSNSPTGIIGSMGVCKGATTSLTDAVTSVVRGRVVILHLLLWESAQAW